jgi:hypothetical protein
VRARAERREGEMGEGLLCQPTREVISFHPHGAACWSAWLLHRRDGNGCDQDGARHGAKGAATLTSGPGPFKLFQTNFQLFQTLKFKTDAFPMSKNIQTWAGANFGHDEQLSPSCQLQNPNITHAINFGTDSNLNFYEF